MDVLDVARQNYVDRQLLARRAVLATRKAWKQIDPKAIRATWHAQVGPAVERMLTGAQAEAASHADTYTAAALRAQGKPDSPEGVIVPEAFSGTASDGRDLATLLELSNVYALQQIQRGSTPEQGLAIGGNWLAQTVGMQVLDAGRAANGVAITSRPDVGGFIRVCNGAACARCAILAGRWYRYNADFERHVSCFPAGVVVSGPATKAATRRWYEGELTIITTASGQRLPATGNHPVLTDRGWVPANLLQEGDDVVRSLLSQGAVPLVVPDEYQMPARIEDLWCADGMGTPYQMPTTAEDFHGDGGYGEVDVVFPDRLLGDGLDAAFAEAVEHELFAYGIAPAISFAGGGSAEQLLGGCFGAAHGGVSCGGLLHSLVGAHAAHAEAVGGTSVADLDALLLQSAADGSAVDVVMAADALLALACEVGGSDFGVGQDVFSPRWDAPSGPLTMQSRLAYASRGQDLGLRLTGQVEVDRVIQTERVQWSGHVYNLTSAEGWYSANGLIVSNCQCGQIPADDGDSTGLRADPMQMFRDGQITGLSAAETQAINDGADIASVVNAHRGMYTLGARSYTREGITRYGSGRLTPAQIYADATSRTQAIDLLRQYGYLA